MADYNLTKSAQAIDDTLNLIHEAVPKIDDTIQAATGVPLNSTVARASVLHANLGASSTAYGDQGNGVSAANAAIAIKGAKDGNIGLEDLPVFNTDLDDLKECGFFRVSSSTSNLPVAGAFFLINSSNKDGQVGQIAIGTNNEGVFWRQSDSDVYTSWQEFYHTGNTTVDSSGFIKEASPIVKLFADKADFNSQCPDNAEFEKVSIGHYKIKGTLGFAQKGWYIENPKDANGNVKVFVEYEQLAYNTIEVKTYSPNYSNGFCDKGQPMDIPIGRWIDLRLQSESKQLTEGNK